MFSRSVKFARPTVKSFKRFNSSHHEPSAPPKNIEISVGKIFGVAALAGGFLVYKNHEATDKPLYSTKLYREEEGRDSLRNENYAKRHRESFVKGFIRDRGGIGQKQYRRVSEGAVPTNLIPTHSPSGPQFGAGIKTDKLGPRKERIRVFAPLSNSNQD